MRILVFTTDIIPLEGLPTSGTALRTFGLIQGLRAHGHEVLISVPKNAIDGLKKTIDLPSLPEHTRIEFQKLSEIAFDASNQNGILADTSPDAVVCGHWPAMTMNSKPAQPLIIDLAGPHMLERHYQDEPNQIGAVLGKLNAVANADFYIVSGPKQRLYFLSYLLRAGVREPESKIVEITMPLNPALPRRAAANPETFPHFVFGGVFLPWQNPVNGIRIVAEELRSRNKGQLTCIGGKHPNYNIKEGVYQALFDELSQHPRAQIRPMLPYEEFISELCRFDAAIDLMEWNLERELAVTIRSTTYLWAGVPVIYNNYADISRLIQRYDAGWCVDPSDSQAVKNVIKEIYESPELVRRKSENAQTLAREVFSWDRAVEPLLGCLVRPEKKRLRETDIIVDFPDNADYPITASGQIEQYFVCRVNGLNRVECRIATHDRSLNNPLAVELFEIESSDAPDKKTLHLGQRTLVAREELEGASLKNNEWHALDVPQQEHSAGKAYVLRLSSNEREQSSSASPWTVKGSPYPMMGFYHGTQRIEHAALCFRTTCAGS